MKKLNSLIGSVFNKGLSLFGLQVKRVSSGLWDLDLKFIEAYENIRDRTLVKIDRSYIIYQFAKSAAMSSDGDVAQVGVYKGGTAKMIAECFTNSNKRIYLFDTFEGLPPMSEKDGIKSNQGNKKKEFIDVDFSEVEAYFSNFPNVEFKKGLFPDTASGLESRQFCFVYLDADLYQSTKDGLNFFYPLMVSGGVIMVDDYETNIWPGVGQAVHEFCTENNIFPIKTVWWQALIIKGNKK